MKQLKITVNGKSYDVTVEEQGVASAPVTVAPVAAPATAPAASAAAGEGEKINAPMNGNIVDVKVAAGQQVKKGDVLVILEAMKMENEIMAPNDGTVTAVCVAKGETVDTGKTLVTIA